jgi:diacylglycerol kinase family enzyme
MVKVIVVINQGGGTAAREEEARRLLHEAGVEAECTVAAPDGLRSAFEAAARQAPDAIIAAGGDGTVGLGAAIAVDHDLPLGILPMGTLNHLARDAGIPANLGEAARVIAACRIKRVDVAEVNGVLFVNNSSVGLYPEMIRERDAQRRRLGRSKRLAMLVASVRALYHFKRRRLTIRIEGEQQPIVTPLLFIGNNDYEISLFALGRRQALDRGELCLYALLARNRRQLIGLSVRRLFGRLDQERDFIGLTGVKAVEIESPYPALSISADGERLHMATPLHYRIRPGVLRLLMPAPEVEATASEEV